MTKRPNICRRITGTAALAAVLMSAGAASAELSDRLYYINVGAQPWGIYSTQVTVAHDGEDWVMPQGAQVKYLFKIDAKTTKSKYKIRKVKIVRGVFNISTNGLKYWELSQVASYPGGNTNHYKKDKAYFFTANGARMRNACRSNYDELQAEGMKHDEILGQDRVVKLDEKFSVAVKTSTNYEEEHEIVEASTDPFYSQGKWAQKTFWNFMYVKCLKSPKLSEVKGPKTPPAGAKDLKIPFTVTRITLALDKAVYTGACPYETKLKIKVYATEPGIAKIRARRAGGLSPVYSVAVKKVGNYYIGEKTILAKLGKPSAKGGLGLKAGAKPIGGPQYAAPTKKNLYQGLFWIKGHGKKSNNAAYKVKCITTPSKDIGNYTGATPPTKPVLGVVQVQPKRKKVRIAARAKPDLVIRKVLRVPGNDRALRVLVKNIGRSTSGRTNLKLFYHRSGKVMVVGTSVGAIAPGKSLWLVVRVGSPLGRARKVTLRVDDPNRVAELNEGNNARILN